MAANSVNFSSSTDAVIVEMLIAAAVAVPALLCVTALRLDAGRIERNASEAHRDGDCSRVLSILDGLWTGHRVVNAPLIVRAEAQTAACRLLLQALRQAQADRPLAVMTLRRYAAHPGALWQGADGRRAELLLAEAADEFDTALTGDITALSTGYTLLSDVLKEFPDREEEAGKVVDELLDRLPVKDACDNRNIVDWLGDRPRRGDVLDRARSTASALVPAALIKCADDLADDERWPEARIWYKMLVDDYPGHELAATARRGIRKADLAIQLETVTKRLEPGSSGKPEYCTNPARYEGAPRYRGRGPHRALIFGQNGHRKRLPSSWLASGAKNAVLVICAGRSTYGTRVATCPYITSANNVYNVSFYRRRIPVRVYELRTGKLVRKTSLQIGGRACPGRIRYTTYVGDAPPSKWYVTSSRWDIRAAYGRLINP